MAVRSFLLSVLARQYALLHNDFAVKYPHAWLAWEAGASAVTPSIDSSAETQRPSALRAQTPQAGDALCFELAPNGNEDTFTVGRGIENRIVISEPTVSRLQLILRLSKPNGWSVEAVPDSTLVLFRSKILGAAEPLFDGSQIIAGNVVLHFHESPAFVERARRAAARLIKT
jgi:hypothetical protein